MRRFLRAQRPCDAVTMLCAEVQVFERERKRKDPIFVSGGRREGLRRPKRLERCPEVDELVLVLKRMLLTLAMVAAAGLMLVKRAIAQEEDSCEYDLAVRLNREDALCLR